MSLSSRKPTRLRIDTSSNDNENNLRAMPAGDISWYGRVLDGITSTFYECKVGISYILPVHFSMMCVAIIDQNPNNSCFGLTIVCYRSDKMPPTCIPEKFVGGSIKPKMVNPGAIRIRLVSSDFEPDTEHGEQLPLAKVEPDFRGRDFDRQFACRFKNRPVKEGVFGKVMIEYVRQNKEAVLIFEFNLAKSKDGVDRRLPAGVAPTDDWALTAVKELADLLYVTENDNWKVLAKKLGFTERERIQIQQHSEHCDPFHTLLTTYKDRGGTPEEFVQALYVVGREYSTASHSNEAQDTFCMKSVSQVGALPNQHSMESRDSGNVDEGDDDVFTAATIPVTKLFQGNNVCLTPPDTPRKRKSISDPTPLASPTKKGRCLTFDDSTVFAFPELNRVIESSPRLCRRELTDADLFRKISKHVHHKWKSIGRNLDVAEKELMCIEQARDSSTECCYHMLLKWSKLYPEYATKEAMHVALLKSGVSSQALRYCGLND